MDIINFISNEGYASFLTKLLIKPYQFKLISHLKTTNESVQEKLQAFQMEDAVKELKKRSLNSDTTEIEEKINSNILKSIKNQELGQQDPKKLSSGIKVKSISGSSDLRIKQNI